MKSKNKAKIFVTYEYNVEYDEEKHLEEYRKELEKQPFLNSYCGYAKCERAKKGKAIIRRIFK